MAHLCRSTWFLAAVVVLVCQGADHQDLRHTGSSGHVKPDDVNPKIEEIWREITKLQNENKALQKQLSKMRTATTQEIATVSKLQMENTLLWDVVRELQNPSENHVDNHNDNTGVYTRWGRMTCPGDAVAVYWGMVAGSYHSTYGGGSTDLACLPVQPQWGSFQNGSSNIGTMFGAQYAGIADAIFDNANLLPEPTFINQDVPCVVCEVNSTSVLMIPGWGSCPGGWNREYWGYLMARQDSQYGGVGHICVDSAPEPGYTGAADEPSVDLYNVEVACGALDCPNYIEGRELNCVVCSK